jgi:hypothetical protein
MVCAASSNDTDRMARIVFLSPQSNYYFGCAIVGLRYAMELGRDSTYRLLYRGRQKERGTWSQSSNGAIEVTCRPFWDTQGPETTRNAAVWQYPDETLLILDWWNFKPVASNDETAAAVALEYGGERTLRFVPTSRLRFEIATGGVNFALGLLAEYGYLAIPLWALLALTDLYWAMLWIVPIAAIFTMIHVRPRTTCPNCGAELRRSALRRWNRLFCRDCRETSGPYLNMPWRIWFLFHGYFVAVIVWFFLLLSTEVSMVWLLWFPVCYVEVILAMSIHERLFAWWVFKEADACALAKQHDTDSDSDSGTCHLTRDT